MSFQHFRLGELAMQQPLPAHLMSHQGMPANINVAPQNQISASQFARQAENSDNSFTNNSSKGHTSTSKQPYGSGDTDDGYTLIFSNIDAFNEWRAKEEETQMVEFVKVFSSDRTYYSIKCKANIYPGRAIRMEVKRFLLGSRTIRNCCVLAILGAGERNM